MAPSWRSTSLESAPGRARSPRLVVQEEREARREPVDEVLSTDRSQLSRAEEPGQRDSAQIRGHQPSIVVGLREHPGTSSVAREQESAGRTAGELADLALQQSAELLVGCGRVADVESQGLPDLKVIADGD